MVEILTLILQALVFVGIVVVVFILNHLVQYYKARLEEEREAGKALRERVQELEELQRKYTYDYNLLKELEETKRKAEREVKGALDDLKRSSGLDRLEIVKNLGDRGSAAAGAVEYLDQLFQEVTGAAAAGLKAHILSSLVKISLPAARPCVKLGLTDSHAGIKAYCAFLAGQHKIADAKDELERMVDSLGESHCVKANARWALMALTGQQTPPAAGITGQIYAYVLLKAPRTDDPSIFAELKKLPSNKKLGIVEAGVVQGAYDVILEVTAPDIDQFHDFIMNSLQGLPWVTFTRTFIVISKPPYFHWIRKAGIRMAPRQMPATSWVLIRVPALQSGGVAVCLEDVPGVVEAATVYGEADIIIKIQADTEENKDRVMSQVRMVPYIYETETYRVRTPVDAYMFERHDNFDLDQELYIG